MNIYERDIFSQADDMRNVLRKFIEEDYPSRLSEIVQKPFKKIIFTGMGSSYFVCYNAVTVMRNHGVECYAQVTSQLVHYELSSIDAGTLVVVVSQSGRSGEVVELVEKIKGKCFILGLCNDLQSPLGLGSDMALNFWLVPEQAVSTRTYLAPIMLLYIMARVFSGIWKSGDDSGIKKTIDCLNESINEFESISKRLDGFFGLPPYVALIGRGYNLSTAEAGALFIKEVAKYPSIPFDAGLFRHGPYEMAGKDFNAFIFAPQDKTYPLLFRLAGEMADKGGKVALITDAMEADRNNLLVIRQNYPVLELADMTGILPVQAFANNIAKRKGLEPGTFLYSSKVTGTQ